MAGFIQNFRDARQAKGLQTPFLDQLLQPQGGLGTGYLANLLQQRKEAGFPLLKNNSSGLLGLSAGLLSGQPGAGAIGFQQGNQYDQQRADQRRQQEEQARQQEAIAAALTGAPQPFQDLAQAGIYDPGMSWLAGQYAPTTGTDPTTDMQNYSFYAQQEQAAGRAPLSFNEWQNQGAGAGEQWQTLTGADMQQFIDQGVPLNPAQVYRLNVGTGELQTVGGTPTGLKLTVDPVTGAITFQQGDVTENANVTGTQRVAATYGVRMQDANDAITANANTGVQLSTYILNNTGTVGNMLASPEAQQFAQAARSFINAVLRRESGAVISDEEFANARQQYLPMPGDSPEVLAQKARNRQVAIAGMLAEAGPQALRQLQEQLDTMGDGTAAPVPTTQQQAGGRQATDANGVIYTEQPDGRWLDPNGREYVPF